MRGEGGEGGKGGLARETRGDGDLWIVLIHSARLCFRIVLTPVCCLAGVRRQLICQPLQQLLCTCTDCPTANSMMV